MSADLILSPTESISREKEGTENQQHLAATENLKCGLNRWGFILVEQEVLSQHLAGAEISLICVFL